MLYGIVLGIHVIICISLVLVVLLQSSKGGGLAGGSAFGGGAESTIFGGRGAATFLSKATTVFGVAFMISSLTLTLMSAGGESQPTSVIAEEAARAPQAPPATAPPGETPALPPPPAIPPSDAPAAPAEGAAGGETTTPDAGASPGSGGGQ